MKLNLRLTLIVLELVLIPLFFLTFVVYSNFQKTLSTEILGQLDTIAQIQKHRAEDLLANNDALVKAITNDPTLTAAVSAYTQKPSLAAQNTLDAELLSIQNDGSGYERVDMLDTSGVVVASTNQGSIGMQENTSSYFIKGSTGDDASVLFTEATGTGEYLAGPVSASGTFWGVLVIRSDATPLASLFQDKSGLGTTGGWALAQQDAMGTITIIPQPTSSVAVQLQNILKSGASSTPLLAALSGQEQDFPNIKNYKGVPVLAATRYIPAANWGISVSIHQDEAFAPIEALKNLLLFLVIIISLIALFTVTSVARSITRPVVKLTKFANGVAGGDFKQKVDIHSSDEIGILATALNEMTAQLNELYGNMEGKIQEKAAALEDGVSKLKAAESEAENQSSLLRQLVDNLPVGIVVMKAPKGEMIVLNRMGAEFLTRGIDPNLTKDDYANTYHFMTEDGRPYPPKELPIIKTLETGMAQTKEGIVVTRTDETKVTLRVSAAPVKDSYGNLLFVVATLEDMAATNEKLAKHDLAAFEVRNEPLDVGLVTDGVIKQWESQIALKHIVLQKEFATDVPLILADAKLLRAVISNILGNAVNYTPEGGMVNISITKNELNILIVIKDTGAGIPAQDQRYIFNSLFRDENIQKYGVNGNGFGLYMVHFIMDQVGGTVHFESAEGMGSTFYVTIPLTGMKVR